MKVQKIFLQVGPSGEWAMDQCVIILSIMIRKLWQIETQINLEGKVGVCESASAITQNMCSSLSSYRLLYPHWIEIQELKLVY